MRLPLLFLVFAFLLACNKKRPEVGAVSTDKSSVKYATNLSLQSMETGTIVSINEAYKGATEVKKYLLTTEENSEVDDSYDAIIPVPVKSIAATATSQIGYLDALDKTGLVTGFATLDFVSSTALRSRIEAGDVIELGRDASNLEALVELSPQLLIAYSSNSEVGQWTNIEQLGIPVLFEASFLETSPLAQAEWIKLFGILTGSRTQADALFNEVEKSYHDIRKQAREVAGMPSVIAGTMYNGTWFMPGGASWVAIYIKDAGARYLWDNIRQTGTFPLSFEAVYETGLQADFWIGATAFHSLDHLLSEDERYHNFKAVNAGQIYTPTARMNGMGGNDYYESGIVRPDLVLKDFVKIVNPEVIPEHQLRYYRRLD